MISFERIVRGLVWGVSGTSFLFGLYHWLVLDIPFIFGAAITYIIVLFCVPLLTQLGRWGAVLQLLLMVNMLLNGWGAFGWYRTIYFYDDLVHFISPVVMMWGFSIWYCLKHGGNARIPWGVVALALFIGFVWEPMEYYGDMFFLTKTYGQTDQPLDTVYDLIMDTSGVAFGYLVFLFTRHQTLRWVLSKS